MKTWGSASTLGLSSHPRDASSSNRRERAARKNLRNVGDTGEGDGGAAVNKTGPRSWGRKVWLPGMDSNHDSRLQRPLSYH